MKTFWERCSFAIVCFLFSIVLVLVGELINVSWLPVLFWTLAIVPFAFSFYRLRVVSRLWYGGFELLIALASIYVGMLKIVETHSAFTFGNALTFWLALWAAIYFMVRALDNIGAGLKDLKLQAGWNALFQIGG